MPVLIFNNIHNPDYDGIYETGWQLIQKAEKRCSFCLGWDIHLFLFLGLGVFWFSGLQTQIELFHWLSWDSSFQTIDCKTSQLL